MNFLVVSDFKSMRCPEYCLTILSGTHAIPEGGATNIIFLVSGNNQFKNTTNASLLLPNEKNQFLRLRRSIAVCLREEARSIIWLCFSIRHRYRSCF
jgi:hypothetical protein